METKRHWGDTIGGLRKKVVVVGAGGNIGSHLATHLARIPDVGFLTLIDPGRYEDKDRSSQEIAAADVGHRKALVQADRLSKIRSDLLVVPVCRPVEAVPWGDLRCDVLLACPDNLRARLHANEVAWRLGIPWIDAGVRMDGLLARVSGYRPGPNHPCLECALDDRDYDDLARLHACLDQLPTAPTNAPSCLGALAASLQALECRKVLAGNGALKGAELIIEAIHFNRYRTTLRRNPKCRFDHRFWNIRPIEVSLRRDTLEAMCERIEGTGGEPAHLRIAGHVLACGLVCVECAARRAALHVESRLPEDEKRCALCGGRMVAPSLNRIEDLLDRRVGPLPKPCLGELGLRDGDVLEVVDRRGRLTHFQIRDPERITDAGANQWDCEADFDASSDKRPTMENAS